MAITSEELKRIISYDRATGTFVWLTRRGSAVAGQRAGCVNGMGYHVIRISKKLELAHRVAWAYEYGEFPQQEIDHINGDPLDNRIENLRLASHAENSRNRRKHRDNATGYKGVTLHQGKYAARICLNGRSIRLGEFSSKEAAAATYDSAARLYHGSFAKQNFAEA